MGVSASTRPGLAGVVPAVHRGSINPEMFDFNSSVLFVAMVVLGGLVSSTLLNLFFLPVLYARFGRAAKGGGDGV